MLKHSTSRWLAGIGVAAAFVATAATPALAAPGIEIRLPDAFVPPGSSGVSVNVELRTDEPTVLRDIEVRYEYGSIADKVTLKDAGSADCTAPEQGVLVCTDAREFPVDRLYEPHPGSVAVVPTAKAKLGDSGDVRISLRAAGGVTATTTAKIRIDEGIDLAGGPHTTLPASKPGGKFKLPLTVFNVGQTTVDGFVAVFELRHAMRTEEQFSNCRYVDDQPIWCQFDDKLPVGEGRTATLDFYFRKDTYAPTNQSGNALWMTVEDFENRQQSKIAKADSAVPGKGPKLMLGKAPKQAVDAAQTDVDPSNNYTGWSIKVNGKNGVDLAAVGDTVQGKAGAVVTATVGFRNNGPATLDRVNGDNEAATHLDVELPPGTSAVETPDDCWLRQGSTRKYLCASGMLLVAGETYTKDFRLRIDKVVPNARGLVRVNAECECPAGGSFDDDIKPANDKTWLVVNPAGSDGGDGGQGGGGSLPITGTPTGLIAGIGGLLLVAGIGGYLLARRRKTHFVA
ncbi:LPXTG cell wall anchor domain-containing protein [Micromonospora sp. DT233]|uniref:LPXTG cell wall anchor domain-containing protein n=1 Tax=Micromonospora sp. DT233 TaxID=3393432 RepID=UPI003CFACAD0